MNRIMNRIATLQTRLDKVAAEDPEAHARMDAATTFETDEVLSLQNLKSLACQNGTLTLEEGMTIYGLLGGETCMPDHVNRQNLAARHTLLVVLAELLKMRIAAKRG